LKRKGENLIEYFNDALKWIKVGNAVENGPFKISGIDREIPG
jgi:hypothetical protein